MIPTYVIGGYGRNITCLDCGLTSWNQNDVRERYCPVCREFHGRPIRHERLLAVFFAISRLSANNCVQ
jgi:hypothetical protein